MIQIPNTQLWTLYHWSNH